MNLSAPFIRRPVATTLLTLGMFLTGVAAFFQLPIAPLPQVDTPVIAVSANLPGAGPETMATSVATPLERHLGVIADVDQMTSQSRTGQTQVVLQFDIDRNINGAARDVQAAINASRVDLPATLRANPTYRKFNPADQPVIILALTSKTRSPGEIYDLCSTILQQRILQIEGVGDVNIGGSSLPAVRIDLNPLALARYGVALEDVRAAVSSANANRPKGVVDAGNLRYQIYTNDTGVKAADFAPLVIVSRKGATVRLSDVASVTDSVEDTRNVGLFNGKPAIIMFVTRTAGANIIATVDRIKAALPQLRAALPPDVDLAVATDRTVTIRASVRDVERTVIMATILVVAVVAFFLRTRGAVLIPSLAVAVSLSGAVAVMLALGFSLDNLSLMALTVSTGFVVDDAIVVVENITRHVEAGMSRMEAALLGAREVGFTVLSITVSLIAVFVPILFMGGIMGRIFREFAMTLSAAILVSLLVSLTTTPMLCALLLRCQHKESRFGRFADGVFARLQGLYARALDWALEWRAVVLVSVLFTVALNIYLFVIVPKGLFPQQDTGQIAGGLQTDQSSSFQITRQRLQRLVDILTREPTMDTAVAFVGGRGPGGFLFASLKPKNVRHESAQSIIGRLRPKLSRVSGAALFLNPVQDLNTGGRSSNSTYQYTLRAESLSDLRLWTNKLTEALKTDPALVDVVNDQQDRGLQADVHIDYDTASRLKLTNRAIDNALYDSFGQRQVTTLYRDTNQYHVVMEIDPALAQDPTILNHVFISTGQPAAGAASASGKAQLIGAGVNVSHAQAGTPGAGSFQTSSVAVGGQAVTGPSAPPTRAASQGVAVSSQAEAIVPLPSVATWREKAAPAEVNHDNGSPSATISYNLAPGRSLGEAAKAIEAAKARIRMPATITGGSQGTAKLFQQSLSSEPMLIAAGLAAIYLVLGILYESYIHPLTVLSTLPSAGVGAVMALILFRMEFSLIALIGVILLIGIVKKNAILMIDFALVAERERGLDPVTAIREAALTRFRPIMMTTFAAILGAIPLALGFGEGAELRQPLGVTVIGGLLVSQALTLLTTPVVYLALDRFRRHRPSPQAAHA